MNSKFFTQDLKKQDDDNSSDDSKTNKNTKNIKPSKPHRLHQLKKNESTDLSVSTAADSKKCLPSQLSTSTKMAKSLELNSNDLKLKPGHKCVVKLNVLKMLDDGKIQSTREIGLVQGDNGSYAFFIWISQRKINEKQQLAQQVLDIETVIPIDKNFNYKLVTLNPLSIELSSSNSDLSLVVTYDDRPTKESSQEKVELCPKSLNEQILLEYDPLVQSNKTNFLTKTITESPNAYQFILFYNDKTENFVSTLQHIVSVSHRTFTERIDFEWTMQYSPATLILNKKIEQNLDSSKLDPNFLNLFDTNIDLAKVSNSKQQQLSGSTMEKNKDDPKNLDLLTGDFIIDTNNANPIQTLSKKSTDNLIFVENNFISSSIDPFNQLIRPESPDHFGEHSDSISDDFDRELQIQIFTEERKNEYVRYEKYSLFIGTWNVNGQTMLQPKFMRTHFLAADKKAPDFYAIGFQELDLSKEAFLFNDNKREDYWLQICQQSLHSGRNYILVRKIRLIGMMLLVFAAEEFRSSIKNVAAETVGTGILGKMGNKGAVAVRFELHDTSICFVNCHLAAHVEQYERRNLDFREINSRLQFYQFKPTPKRICDHDQIYWFGDLNYRIMNLNADQVKMMLDKKQFDQLLLHDQLKQQMQLKNCFQGYIEGPIRHMPSYKYNPGTNQWDSSEKRRPPAWCDRILWRGENIEQTNYRSHPDLKDSDHKPVSALFDSQVLLIDHVLKRKVHEDVMKKLDKVENELLPQVSIDTTEINFGTVSFKDNIFRVLNLTNTGQSRIRFRFINKPNDSNFCKPWLRVTPSTGTIRIKEQITIVFEINFDDPLMAYKFNYGIEKLSDTLVLSLIGGKDIFITISGDYKLSCFGCSIKTLVQLEKPLTTLTLAEFQQMFDSHKIKYNPELFYQERLMAMISTDKNKDDKDEKTMKNLPVPKELFALIDYLSQNGHINPNIFQSSGMEMEFLIIRDALDSSCPEKIKNLSEHSIAEALLLFLETLPEPVIPYYFYDRISRIYGNNSECKQIYIELPEINRKTFQYLMLFLQELCNFASVDKPLNKLYIAKLFGPILVRKFPESLLNDRSTVNKDMSTMTLVQQQPTQQPQNYPSTLSKQLLPNTNVTATSSNVPGSASSSVNLAKRNLFDNLTPEQFFINYFLNSTTW